MCYFPSLLIFTLSLTHTFTQIHKCVIHDSMLYIHTISWYKSYLLFWNPGSLCKKTHFCCALALFGSFTHMHVHNSDCKHTAILQHLWFLTHMHVHGTSDVCFTSHRWTFTKCHSTYVGLCCLFIFVSFHSIISTVDFSAFYCQKMQKMFPIN